MKDYLAIFKDTIFYNFFSSLPDELIQQHIDLVLMSPNYFIIKSNCLRYVEYWVVLTMVKVLNAMKFKSFIDYSSHKFWNETIVYNVDDIVFGTDFFAYRSLVDNNLNNDPINDDTNWVMINLSLINTESLNQNNEVSNVKRDEVGDEIREYFEPKNKCEDCEDTPLGYIDSQLDQLNEICIDFALSGGIGTDYGCRSLKQACLKDEMKWRK